MQEPVVVGMVAASTNLSYLPSLRLNGFYLALTYSTYIFNELVGYFWVGFFLGGCGIWILTSIWGCWRMFIVLSLGVGSLNLVFWYLLCYICLLSFFSLYVGFGRFIHTYCRIVVIIVAFFRIWVFLQDFGSALTFIAWSNTAGVCTLFENTNLIFVVMVFVNNLCEWPWLLQVVCECLIGLQPLVM